MLRRFLVGLSILQFVSTSSAWAAGSDAANIRSMRANALQHFAQGQVDTGLKIFEDAIVQAERTFGKDSTYVSDLCFDAGMAALRTDQYQKAELCLTKAVTVNPNSTEARLKLAEYYKVKGRLHDAKNQLSKVLHQDPSNLEARQLLALTYEKEGNPARANRECYELAEMASGHSVLVAQMAPLPGVRPPAAALPINPLNVRAAQPAKPVEAEPPAAAPAQAPKTPAPAMIKPPTKEDLKAKAAKEKEQKAAQDKKDQAAKRAKAEARARDKKRKKDQQPSVIVEAESGMMGIQSRIKAKAVLLTPVKKAVQPVESATSEPAEEGFGGAVVNRPVRKPAPAPVVVAAPKPRPTKAGFVPPPPAIPLYPAAMAPPPPQPKPAPPVLKAIQSKPVEDPGDEKPSSSSSSSEARGKSAPVDDDDDFLLDWAGKKKKKGK